MGIIIFLTVVLPLLFKGLKFIFKILFFTKKISIVMIGQASSGKTTLGTILSHPHTPKEQLLNFSPTTATKDLVKESHFYAKRNIEVLPKFKDYQGGKPFIPIDYVINKSKGWFSFLFNYVLLLVITPVKSNQSDYLQSQGNIGDYVDKEYIIEQTQYLCIESNFLFSSKNVKRPLAVILFISKFDLFSKESPEDSSARMIEQEIREIFKEPIQNISELKEDYEEIPLTIIVGSSIEKWGRKEIIEFISECV